MNKGTIFFHKKFEFRDGEIGRKLLILLNNPEIKKNIPVLVCRTTSNPKNKPFKRGCYDTKNLFMIPAKHDFFDSDTWVLLHEIFEFKAEDLLNLRFKGYLEILAILREQTINEIINCIRKTQDVSSYHLKILKGK